MKKLWWAIKVFFFPHLDRRNKPRASKVVEVEDMLATAIINLSDAIKDRK